MYIVWNAIKNLGRNKGRNILMAAIIFVIIVATVVSIIINTTTASIIKDYKERFGSEISIEIKRDEDATVISGPGSMPQSTTIPKVPTSRQILDFGKSDYLKTAEYTTYSNGDIISDSTNKQSTGEKVRAFITGSSRDYINQDFKSGTKKIVDGQKYENPNECLIPDEYAKKNSLSIGDTITVEISNLNQISDLTSSNQAPQAKERHVFKISGLYKDYSLNTQVYANEVAEILVDLNTLINMKSFNMDSELGVFGTFFLKDPDMLEDFTTELRNKGLSDDMEVLTDEKGYKQVVGPVEGLAKIATTFMVAVLILGCAILLVISILTIRERKYEIGVLRAMGMKKVKIAVGLLAETIIITAVCLVIGLGIGAEVSQPVANSLLSDQVRIAEESQNNALGGLIGKDPDKAELSPLSKVDVNLDMQAVIQIIFVSLLIAGVSSIIGIFYITRYEPMRILSERN